MVRARRRRAMETETVRGKAGKSRPAPAVFAKKWVRPANSQSIRHSLSEGLTSTLGGTKSPFVHRVRQGPARRPARMSGKMNSSRKARSRSLKSGEARTSERKASISFAAASQEEGCDVFSREDWIAAAWAFARAIGSLPDRTRRSKGSPSKYSRARKSAEASCRKKRKRQAISGQASAKARVRSARLERQGPTVR